MMPTMTPIVPGALRATLTLAVLAALAAGCGGGSGEPGESSLDTRLIEAAWAGDVALARRLIEAGADVNHQDATQQSAYLIAASEGHLALLELTLESGARVNDLDSYDGTALIRAAERGHAEVVRRLIRAGVDPDHVNNLGWTALHEAVILGDGGPDYVRTVRALVHGGADPSIPSSGDGLTALEHARARGYDDLAAILSRAATGG